MSTIDPNQTSAQKIGAYIRYQRTKRDYSIDDLAKKCDLNPSFIFRLEKGAYETIRLNVIEKLAAGLKMSIQSLLFKSEIITTSDHLPRLEYYLKEKYQFSPEVIEEVRTFINFMHFKHDEEIAQLKQLHEAYWNRSDYLEE